MKPLYDGEFNAFSEFDKLALTYLVRSLKRKNVKVVEIGSWMGNGSTTALVNVLNSTDSQIFCIDHWKGNKNIKRHQDIVARYDIFNTFRNHIQQISGDSLVKPMMMSSEEAASVISDHCFDLIFIDSEHSYESTMKDIELWRSKVKPGGILCGHGCEIKPDVAMRKYLWERRAEDFVSVTHPYHRYAHPGSVLAVNDTFSENVHLWGEEERSLKLENDFTGRSSIWDIII